jgi:hypothetical protein
MGALFCSGTPGEIARPPNAGAVSAFGVHVTGFELINDRAFLEHPDQNQPARFLFTSFVGTLVICRKGLN